MTDGDAHERSLLIAKLGTKKQVFGKYAGNHGHENEIDWNTTESPLIRRLRSDSFFVPVELMRPTATSGGQESCTLHRQVRNCPERA